MDASQTLLVVQQKCEVDFAFPKLCLEYLWIGFYAATGQGFGFNTYERESMLIAIPNVEVYRVHIPRAAN